MIRSLLKQTADLLAAILVLPAVVACRLQSALFTSERAFPGWSQLFSLVPGTTGVYLRRAFYRRILQRCADGSVLGFGTIFSHATASIGRNVYVGNGCMLGGITIEDDCLLGSHVSVLNGLEQHGTDRLDIPIREQPGHFLPVTIGRDSWIGERAVIAADVGRHCIIGAGSVVTRPIPDYAIAAGAPARVIRSRKSDTSGPAESEPVAMREQALATVDPQ